MKTIKIIDLYNLIANKEFDKLPKKVKYRNIIFDLENKNGFINYKPREGGLNQFLWKLNDEVEILEETNKIPEKLGLFSIQKQELSEIKEDTELTLSYERVSNTFTEIYHKINEILDYLESKRDE